ncbi:MAG: metallophosphoesterase family protein [Nanoarchaeota archaeon]|nr:metallophosphoesterase family protein [Nanoarchaeota archaeon]MBU1050952.1 metallophosphoesterase family protein [Nanoarchaeota archaeon]
MVKEPTHPPVENKEIIKKKLRILAAGDTHGDSRLTKKLADRAEREEVDLVVLCGDITGWVETKDIIKPFKDKHKRVLILPGNWDSFATADFLAQLYGVRNIHGYAVKYEDVGFFGAGGADGPGPGATTERELMKNLEKAHRGLKGIEKKIMVTHMHPAGSKSEFSGIGGSAAVRKAIKEFEPDILLHSHIHEASGMEEKIGKTRVINVGREGKVIEI